MPQFKCLSIVPVPTGPNRLASVVSCHTDLHFSSARYTETRNATNLRTPKQECALCHYFKRGAAVLDWTTIGRMVLALLNGHLEPGTNHPKDTQTDFLIPV